MAAKQHRYIITLFLILILCANLANVQAVRADGEIPTEPPAATEIATEAPAQPPVESTPEPVEATPAPEEPTALPVEEILTQVPAATEVVVLDESGDTVPLASEEAAEITELYDPMWCPAGTLPGDSPRCQSFSTVSQLVSSMSDSPTLYEEHGIIYFQQTTGSQTTGGSFDLTAPSLGSSDFNTLHNYNLTLQGGWNGSNGSGATFLGATNFGTNHVQIGTSGNPWAGNIVLSNFQFNGVSSANAVTVYTTTGNVTLSNVDVRQQTGSNYTALLNSNSGNISIQDGSTFDGDNIGGDHSRGLSATTATGTISITGTSGNPITFEDSDGSGATNHNGATLSAPRVLLDYVTASMNDGNGIAISNANFVTLNNVVSGPNVNNQGNGLSGVLVNGTGSTIVSVGGGVFADNGRYGIEVVGGSIYIRSAPTCPTTGNTRNGLGCYSLTPSSDSTGPVITPTVSGTTGSGGWYTSDVTVTWAVSDPQSGILSSTGCDATTFTSETGSASATCSATNGAGASGSASVTIKIDKTAPTLTLPTPITKDATSPSGAVVSYTASATDNMGGSIAVNCAPASNSMFPIGTTTVNCSSTDAASNTSTGSFQVTVQSTGSVTVTPPTGTSTPPTVTSTPPAPTSEPSTGGSSGSPISSTSSESNSSAFTIPLTGGKLINLDCNTVFWAFNIKLSFLNLCDQQTMVDNVAADKLPGELPAGFQFVMGLNVDILTNGQSVAELPDSTGIQMDFPAQSNAQFAVLYWDGSRWVEVSEQAASSEISSIIGSTAGNGLYRLTDGADNSYPILTAHQTGTFVLVKK